LQSPDRARYDLSMENVAPTHGPVHAPHMRGPTLQLWLTPAEADAVAQEWEAARLADLALCEALVAAWAAAEAGEP
jgi:hypothetical protein